MARSTDNMLTRFNSGKIGNQFVMKQRNNETFTTKYPDRSHVILSALQKKRNGVFQRAVEYAQAILKDPDQFAAYTKKLKSSKSTRHQAVYQAAIQEFMEANEPKVRMADAEAVSQEYRSVYPISERQGQAIKYLALDEVLSNKVYQQLNKVSKPTATRDLQEMVHLGIISLTGVGAGARYSLLPLPPKPAE